MSLLNSFGTRCRIVDPQHLAIFRGMLTVALFTMLGKLMSAAKEMAVAYRYGLAAEVDAYQFVYNLVSWPLGIWASVLTAVLVPLVARMHVSSPQAIPRFRAELAGFTLMLGGALVLLVGLGIGALLRFDRSGLPAYPAQLAATALPGMLVMLPLGLVVALLSAWLLAAQRHVNTLLDCVPTLFIAVAVLTFTGGGIGPLVWGTVAGGTVHLLVLVATMTKRHALDVPVFTRTSSHWQWFFQGFGIMLAGQALMSFTVIIDQFNAVGLGTGALARLGYANRVLSLILGLAAIAVSRATLPVFSQASADATGDVYRVAASWARLMFVGGVVVMLLSYLIAPWAIRLLFERGQFDATDTAQVTEVLRYGLPQLPFYFSSMVLVSYALSQRRHGLIFWSGVIGCGGKVIGNLLLVPHLGVNGIALATMVVYGLNASFFWLVLRRRPSPRRPAPCSREGAYPVKILLLMHSLSAGGAERAACTLANFWANRGREVTMVTLAPVSADFYPLDRRVARISLHLAGDSRHPLHGLWQNVQRVLTLRRLLRSLQPHIALAMMSTPNVLLALASRWLPALCTIGSERCYPPHAPLGRLWQVLRRILYGRLSAMVALTGECAHWIETRTSASRVVVIPNAIAWPLPGNPSRRHLARLCRPQRKLLLAAGRLEPVKNFDALIRVFKRLAGAFPDWDLVILGEGPERARLASMIDRMALAQRVVMPGVAGNIAHWYGQADLFALTSLSEGFPNVLAEAMAHGVPVVSVDCDTGPRDIVRHGIDGLLVPPNDTAALSDALARVMGDAAFRKQLAASAVQARERFSTARIGQMWDTLFLNLCGQMAPAGDTADEP